MSCRAAAARLNNFHELLLLTAACRGSCWFWSSWNCCAVWFEYCEAATGPVGFFPRTTDCEIPFAWEIERWYSDYCVDKVSTRWTEKQFGFLRNCLKLKGCRYAKSVITDNQLVTFVVLLENFLHCFYSSASLRNKYIMSKERDVAVPSKIPPVALVSDRNLFRDTLAFLNRKTGVRTN